MEDLLGSILCWIQQMGAMFLGALIEGVNLIIVGIASAVQGALDAWPIGMPVLPTMPAGLLTAWGWVRWTPLPVDAGLALLTFLFGVWILWIAASILLRWAKVVSD